VRRLVVLALLLPGCVQGPAADDGPGTATLRGAFTEAATQADMADFGEEMRAYGRDVDVRLMESFPVQFAVEGVDAARCDEAREAARAKPYVARVDGCPQASR